MIIQLLNIPLYLFIFLLPLFSLPITPESYEYNKMALLVGAVPLLILLSVWKAVRRKQMVILKGKFMLPLFLIAAVSVVSLVFQSPNITVALTTPLSTATVVFSFLLYCVLLSLLDEKEYNIISLILTADALFIAGYVFLSFSDVFPQNFYAPSGTLLVSTVFLGTMAFFTGVKLLTEVFFHSRIRSIHHASHSAETAGHHLHTAGTDGSTLILPAETHKGDETRYFLIFHILTFFFLSGITLVLFYSLLYKQKPAILPVGYGWPIFAEILKNPKTLFLGIGPSNFMTAFALAKPVSINATPFWNITFTSSSSFLLNLATETGIISFLSYISLLVIVASMVFRLLKILFSTLKKTGRHLAGAQLTDKLENEKNYISALPAVSSLLFILILQMLLPTGMSVLFLTVILLVLSDRKSTLGEIDLSKAGKLGYIFLLPVILFMAVIYYFGGNIYYAETVFKQSLDALVNQKGADVYNLQLKAISINPAVDRYHVAFSQTNLALANALSGQEKISDEDKKRIPQLVQQSIDEARKGVLLYKTNPSNWDNLGRIYAFLRGFAKDSESWAIQTYQQKIRLDPFSPGNYITLGGIYLNLGQYDEAEKQFQSAINLKSDFANAYYNLAWTFKGKQKYKEAYKALASTQSLVPPNTEDAKKVDSELQAIYALMSSADKKEVTASGEQTVVPQQEQTELENPVSTAPAEFTSLPTLTPDKEVKNTVTPTLAP